MKRIALALLIWSVLALGAAAPAAAQGGDPPKAFGPVTVDCGGGLNFDIVDQGNGQWVPGHILSSTRQLIVTAFPAFHIEVRVAGELVSSEDRPPVYLGDGNALKNSERVISCDFSFDVSFDGVNVSGFGEVQGFLTPAN